MVGPNTAIHIASSLNQEPRLRVLNQEPDGPDPFWSFYTSQALGFCGTAVQEPQTPLPLGSSSNRNPSPSISEAIAVGAMATRALSQKEQDIQLMLAAEVHLGTKNCDFQMERYSFKRRSDGNGALHLTEIALFFSSFSVTLDLWLLLLIRRYRWFDLVSIYGILFCSFRFPFFF